ncbi:MAG TPA: GNAT family N-acetyltransferase [Gemmatimonadales bacterium]|nr:GNAT family N-acetyltransferase [Gemmatimonadales bacterium]
MSGPAAGGWHTARLLIRGWAPPDAPALKAAIDGSLAELQRWMAWAKQEPSDLPVIAERLARFQAEFAAGINWACGIFLRSSGEVLGGASLLSRVGPGALELGYWLRNECTGRGYATEASAALTRIGLAMQGIERIEIRCDPDNRPSFMVAERLGYRLLRTSLEPVPYSDGEVAPTMVWELRRGDAEAALAAWPPSALTTSSR